MTALIPNLLTLARLFLAPVVAWCMWQGFSIPFLAQFGPDALNASAADIAAAEALGLHYKQGAAILFVIAALTDLFDGMAARALDAESKFGRIIDPIADKALVGLPLLMLVYISGLSSPETVPGAFDWRNVNWWVAIPTFVIVGRDLLITVLRMFASDGEGPRVAVLSKWKTALELVAVALPIFLALPFLPFSAALMIAWLAILWLAAALSAFTGLGYLIAPSR